MPAQIALALPAQHGGARAGAGRPKLAGNHDSPHRPRAPLTRHTPVHVVFRTCSDVHRLRRGPIYKALLPAFAALRDGAHCRVVHASIQHNHLHLLVEADSAAALARGMQSFAIRAARAINRVQRRAGRVFAFRYHATPITSPRHARGALAYVLNNWRRHREHLADRRTRAALLDPYASGLAFDGWTAPHAFAVPTGFVPLPVAPPRSWLLTTGWRRYHRVHPREAPGPL